MKYQLVGHKKESQLSTIIWIMVIIAIFSYVILVGFTQYDNDYKQAQQNQIDAQNKVIYERNHR